LLESYQECDDYEQTTEAEIDEPPEKQRKRKPNTNDDFVTHSDGMIDYAPSPFLIPY